MPRRLARREEELECVEKFVEREVWETREEDRVNVMEGWEESGLPGIGWLGRGLVGRVFELGNEGG